MEVPSALRKSLACLIVEPLCVYGLHTSSPLEIYFSVRNIGSAAASNVDVASSVLVLRYPYNHEFSASDSAENRQSEVAIFPSGSISLRRKGTRPLSPNDISAICRGDEYRLYLIGRVNYRSTDGQDLVTNFRLSQGGRTLVAASYSKPGDPAVLFEHCEVSNTPDSLRS